MLEIGTGVNHNQNVHTCTKIMVKNYIEVFKFKKLIEKRAGEAQFKEMTVNLSVKKYNMYLMYSK